MYRYSFEFETVHYYHKKHELNFMLNFSATIMANNFSGIEYDE